MRLWLLVAGLCLFTACAQLSGMPAGDTAASAQEAPRYAGVAVVLGAELAVEIGDDPRFNFPALRDAIGAELRARRLLGASGTGTVEILVNEFKLSATSNVVMFGRLSSVGVLGGVLRLRADSGAAPREIKVRVEMPLSVSQRKAEADSLQKLYRQFASQSAEEIAAASLR